MIDMDTITFFWDWIPLDKKEFRILAMLADVGTYEGNLTALCRYFSLNPQSSTRNQLRNSIDTLAEKGYIRKEQRGRTYILNAIPIPKGRTIGIKRKWFVAVRDHQYQSASVSWEAIIKVLLWLIGHTGIVFTNAEMAEDLHISVSTIGEAKKVLETDFQAIVRDYVSVKVGENLFQRIGQIVDVCAWWWEDG